MVLMSQQPEWWVKHQKQVKLLEQELKQKIDARVQQNLTVEGISSLTFSKYTGRTTIEQSGLKFGSVLMDDGSSAQMYAGIIRGYSSNKIYLYIWLPVHDEKGFTNSYHFICKPALTATSIKKLTTPDVPKTTTRNNIEYNLHHTSYFGLNDVEAALVEKDVSGRARVFILKKNKKNYLYFSPLPRTC